jgi:hypothetical protein
MRARALALLLLLPLAAACGDKTPPPAPRATRTIVTTSTPLPLPTVEGKPVHFRTFDGKVGCDLESTYVLCNVKNPTYEAPKKPSDCLYTWGKAVEFTIGGKGSFFCGHGENYLDSKRVLGKNQALKVGFITCRAYVGFVECSGQGNGFRFGPASYRMF